MIRLFVYGTLRSGEYNYDRWQLARHARAGGATTLNGAVLFDLGPYPCMVLTDDRRRVVVGELFEIDRALFDRIAAMEGEAGYCTVTCDTQVGPAATFVFERAPETATVIESGDWLARPRSDRSA